MPYTDFHYTPTGTGVISGKEVLEQTEDAINDLGGQISGDVQTAIDTANNALNTANTASADAQNAVNTANTAYTAATNAQNTANAAQTTATNAQNAATAAQNDVDALENVVTDIEGRLTTTEDNVTNLTTRMRTAENNITTLQNDVVTAQGTATSAQNTATLAREQAYVTRYTNTAVSDNSTVAYSDLNNTDNIKIGDFILDVNGKLFAITAVDSVNETVSVTTPLTQLAVDSGVLHKSGNETKSGELTVTKVLTNNLQAENASLALQSSGSNRSCAMYNGSSAADGGGFWCFGKDTSNGSDCRLQIYNTAKSRYERVDLVNSQFLPTPSGELDCGGSSNKWKSINGLNPGALSLPDYSSKIDISGYVTNLNGVHNSYTPSVDGWIAIQSSNATLIRITDTGSGGVGNTVTSQTAGVLTCMIPVRANRKSNIYIVCTTLTSAYFIPCQGNV